MRNALLSFALAAAMLCACSDVGWNAEEETASAEEPDSMTSPPLELTPSERPPSVKGCSCLLAEDPAQYRNAQFVYAEKYGLPTSEDFAFVFINGKPVRLRLQDFRADDEAGTRTVVYVSDEYEVTVDLQQAERPDHEVWVQTGTLTLESAGGTTIEQDVYGVCGC
jgi:hypothetical protein